MLLWCLPPERCFPIQRISHARCASSCFLSWMNLNPLLLLLLLDGDGACWRVEKEATIVRFRAVHHAPDVLGLGLEVGAEEEAANGYSKATRAPPFSMVAPLPDPLVLHRILPSAAGSFLARRRLLRFSMCRQKERL